MLVQHKIVKFQLKLVPILEDRETCVLVQWFEYNRKIETHLYKIKVIFTNSEIFRNLCTLSLYFPIYFPKYTSSIGDDNFQRNSTLLLLYPGLFPMYKTISSYIFLQGDDSLQILIDRFSKTRHIKFFPRLTILHLIISNLEKKNWILKNKTIMNFILLTFFIFIIYTYSIHKIIFITKY